MSESKTPIDQCAENTDREIYRERDGDYYADSLHVTQEGAIGINCGGYVIVMPIRAWHGLAKDLTAALKRVKGLEKENNTLRGLLGNSAKPCSYCGLAAEDQAKCERGFPGCARADDQMLSQHFADAYRAEKAERERDEAEDRADAMQDYNNQIAASCKSRINKLERELAEANELAEKNAKDAERYRWLLNQVSHDNFVPIAQCVWKKYSAPHEEWVNLINGADLDAHIDAAIERGR